MKIKLFFSILTLLITFLSLALTAEADQVPWSSEEYTAYVIYENGLSSGGDSDSGPPLPITASATDNYIIVTSTITDSTMSVYTANSGPQFTGATILAETEFGGRYTANDPYFLFSYNIDETPSSLITGMFMFNDVTTGDFQFSTPFYDENTFYIPTIEGHTYDVSLSLYSHEPDPFGGVSSASLTYSMSVIPEPISSILFVTGGATLGFRRFWKKRKTA
jgi:hypothetical protein